MAEDTPDQLAIRDNIEAWAIWSDAGDWDKFRTCWHPDGYMFATWFQAPCEDFITARREGWDKGVSILHFLGGMTIELAGRRAVAQTKMTISQRAPVHGVVCDVVCTGRFYDLFENRAGRWGMVLRQPIYEKDQLVPVDHSATVALDAELLARFPEGYRHLAYIQTQVGYPVKDDMPGLKGAEVEALYRCGKAWLAGEAVAWGPATWGAAG